MVKFKVIVVEDDRRVESGFMSEKQFVSTAPEIAEALKNLVKPPSLYWKEFKKVLTETLND